MKKNINATFSFLSVSLLSIFFLACGNSENSTTTDTRSNTSDSTSVSVNNNSSGENQKDATDSDKIENNSSDADVQPEDVDINALAHKFGVVPSMEDPYVIDSLYLTSTHDKIKSNLTGPEVKLLSAKFNDHESGKWSNWIMNDIFNIDSIKRAGEYETYVANLDLGNTKDAVAYAVGKVALPKGQELLLWAADYKSYEACPSFAGTSIFGSVLEKEIVTCFRLGELSHSADPPVGGETNHYSNIYQSGKIEMNITEITDEEDEEGNAITTTTKTSYVLNWADGKLKEKKKTGPVTNTTTLSLE